MSILFYNCRKIAFALEKHSKLRKGIHKNSKIELKEFQKLNNMKIKSQRAICAVLNLKSKIKFTLNLRKKKTLRKAKKFIKIN